MLNPVQPNVADSPKRAAEAAGASDAGADRGAFGKALAALGGGAEPPAGGGGAEPPAKSSPGHSAPASGDPTLPPAGKDLPSADTAAAGRPGKDSNRPAKSPENAAASDDTPALCGIPASLPVSIRPVIEASSPLAAGGAARLASMPTPKTAAARLASVPSPKTAAARTSAEADLPPAGTAIVPSTDLPPAGTAIVPSTGMPSTGTPTTAGMSASVPSAGTSTTAGRPASADVPTDRPDGRLPITPAMTSATSAPPAERAPPPAGERVAPPVVPVTLDGLPQHIRRLRGDLTTVATAVGTDPKDDIGVTAALKAGKERHDTAVSPQGPTATGPATVVRQPLPNPAVSATLQATLKIAQTPADPNEQKSTLAVGAAPLPGPAASMSPPSSTPPLPVVAAPVVTISLPPGAPGWNDSLGDRVLWMAGNKIHNAEIHLNPADLGPLRVHISVDDGTANVNFHAHHPLTRDAIEQALPRLRHMLGDQGLALGNASVFSHDTPHHQSQPGRPAPPLDDEPAAGIRTPVPRSTRVDAASGMVDLFA